MIINTFPEGSRHREEFSRIMFTAGYISFNAARDAAAAAEAYHSGFIRAQTLLESIIEIPGILRIESRGIAGAG